MPANTPSVVFVGGGPRTAGILERLAANRPELFRGRVDIHVVEPHTAGSGRIWRYEQHAGLMLNSAAADVTMFTDASVECDGPAADGPALADWAAGVLDGSITDVPDLPAGLRRQLEELTGSTFPTRQLQSAYLEWFFRRAAARLAPAAAVTVHRDTAVGIDAVRSRTTPARTSCGWRAARRCAPTSWCPPWGTRIRCPTRPPRLGRISLPGTAASTRHRATRATSTTHPSVPART